MKSEIESLKVRCSNSKEGCAWTGELRSLRDHLASLCGQHEMACPNNCTVSKIKREHLKNHLTKECVLRKYTCQYCGREGVERDRGGHLTWCNKVPVPCPNKCGEMEVVRERLKEHLGLCRLQVVTCEYAGVGCKAPRTTRQDMLLHACKEQERHLELVTRAYRTLNHAVEAMRVDARTLREKSTASYCIETCTSTVRVRDVSREGKLWFRMPNVKSEFVQEGKTWKASTSNLMAAHCAWK